MEKTDSLGNILITSAGKRVELLKEFKCEAAKIDSSIRVLTVDLNPKMAPACWLSDEAFAVPRVTDEKYIAKLLDICDRNQVRLVIPTIDTELAILSAHRAEFAGRGIEIMVSDSDFISTCRDKRKTIELFERLNIRNPESRDKHNPVFPMFAKPYDGSLSTNIHVIRNESELTQEILDDPKLIFMEYIDKNVYKEYTVDMYYGADSRVKSIVPRERIEIRSGEVNKGRTCKNSLLNYLRERMEYMPGVRGCICIQLFYNEQTEDVAGIEINPRYGGGYPLSYYAGANFPRLMIEEYMMGVVPEYSDSWIDRTVMLRYDSQVIFHESDEK